MKLTRRSIFTYPRFVNSNIPSHERKGNKGLYEKCLIAIFCHFGIENKDQGCDFPNATATESRVGQTI